MIHLLFDKKGKIKKPNGKSLDFIEVPDPPIRLRAWEHVADLKKQTGGKTPTFVNQVNVNRNNGFTKEEKAKERELLSRLNKYFKA